jgi:peptidylprolyl isomerase
MATTKRERQKAARREKLEQQQREAKRRQGIRRIVIVGIVAVVVIGSAALLFAGKSSTPTTTTTSTSTTTTTAVTTTTAAAITFTHVANPLPAGTFGSAPTVSVPAGAAPTTPESVDLITGTGAVLKSGQTAKMQYVLATYSSRKVVQSSWTSAPFSTVVDSAHLIPGFAQGVVGMRVGGRRELILPPSVGYGATSPGTGIAANDTLIFVVDLLKVS